MSALPMLDGWLKPLSQCLDAESAQRVVALQPDAAVQTRMTQLAERSSEGLLTPEEREKYEALVNAADLIMALQLKARRQYSRGQ